MHSSASMPQAILTHNYPRDVTCVRYQLQGYAETLVWDIDVMMRHMQKLEIGIEGREAIGESTQQLMDHMKRRIPDMMNWRKRCNFFVVLNYM